MWKLMVHLFLPHHTNNQRAKLLHLDSLLVYLLLFGIFHLGVKTIQKTYPDILGYATDIQVAQLLEATNGKRAAAGLPPLTLNEKLSAAAANKAVDMFTKNYWAHNSPDGRTPWDFITSAGYRYTVAGENLAKNFSTSSSVVDAWMASPTHRDNILKPNYREVGFAVVNGVLAGEETTLVVQMFGAAAPTVVSVLPSPKPVQVGEAATQTAQLGAPVAAPIQTVAAAFAGVSKKPHFNIPTLSKDVAYLFIGILMTALILDAWLASRRRTIRISGHNIAHLFFFGSILIVSNLVSRGSLL